MVGSVSRPGEHDRRNLEVMVGDLLVGVGDVEHGALGERLPTIWNDSGRPASLNPHGTAAAGRPARFHWPVKLGWVSRLLTSIVSVRSAGVVIVGISRTSTSPSTPATAARNAVRNR